METWTSVYLLPVRREEATMLHQCGSLNTVLITLAASFTSAPLQALRNVMHEEG